MPGLGRFYAVPHKASFASTTGTIAPPKIQYLFEDSNSSDSKFIEFVASVLGTNFDKAEKKVGKFTQDIFNRLLNYKKADIPYIGELKQTKDSKIVYSPDDELQNLEIAYLPSLRITPVIRQDRPKDVIIKEAISANKTYQSDFQTTTPVEHTIDVINKSRWTDYLLSVVLVLILIFGMRSCFKLANDNQLRNSSFNTESTVTSGGTLDTVDSKDNVDAEEESIEDTDGSVSNSDTNSTDESISNSNTNSSDVPVGNSNADSTNESVSNNNTNNTDTKDEELDPKQATTNDNKPYANGVTSAEINNGCVIIVGAYSRYSNIDKMVAKIKSKGLESYVEENENGLSRVGFRFDCDQNTDLEAYLRTVRKDFKTDAWYLNPAIEVF